MERYGRKVVSRNMQWINRIDTFIFVVGLQEVASSKMHMQWNLICRAALITEQLLMLSSLLSTLQLIPPRGCAYVCFALRRDAARALDRLKGYKLNGSMLKVCRYGDESLLW